MVLIKMTDNKGYSFRKNNEYLGTISIDRKVTAHLRDSHYELRQGSTFSSLIYDEVLGALKDLSVHLIDGGQVCVGKWLFQNRELKALWNTMLAYMRLMGKDTKDIESQLNKNQDALWTRQEGIMPELKEPLTGDEL
jgi:hypothetical protein